MEARLADQVLWDVVRQHLDEAEFLLEVREAALDAPHYNLAEIAAGPERRLLAHLDALNLAGPEAHARLLIPAISNPHAYAEAASVATLALLLGADAYATALELLDSATEPEPRAGIVHALALHRDPKLDALVIQTIEGATGPATAARLQILAARPEPIGAWIYDVLRSDDLDVAGAAARLARRCADPQALAALRALAEAEDPALRCVTIESALCRGLDGAWSLATYWAFITGASPFRRDALTWAAMLGDAATHARVLAMLDGEDTRADALWALGFGGRPSAIDHGVALLADAAFGPLAGELICAIAGLPSDDDRFWLEPAAAATDDEASLPALDREELDTDLVPEGEDALPRPNPDAIAQWWAERRANFDPATRYLGGQPVSAAVVLEALRDGPARRRHGLALEWCMRSETGDVVDTRAWATEQRRVLGQLGGAVAPDFQRGLAPG